MRLKSKYIILNLLLLFTALNAIGQNDEGFIYGKVTTKSNSEYVGLIRWGGEEIFWNDVFNSIKIYGNKTINVPETEDHDIIEETEKDAWDILNIWENMYSGQLHQFSCRFGDIKRLVPGENGNVIVVFKNNQQLKVKGGSNDIHATVSVYDYEIGEISLKWDKLKKVEFFDTPTKIINKPGNPLNGTVHTKSGQFVGLIQWDHDERIGTDVLDIHKDKMKLQIEFKKVKCLNKSNCNTIITLVNDTKINASGSNDVNCENRGIIVTIDKIGKVDIPWTKFERVCFDNKNDYSGEAYRDYTNPKRLKGTVKKINNESVSGFIVFDKDEQWDFEHLEGLNEGLKYVIPFRNIESVIPKNLDYTYINLRNGTKLLLGQLQDVSAKNEGVLVYTKANGDPVHIDWEEIDEILLE